MTYVLGVIVIHAGWGGSNLIIGVIGGIGYGKTAYAVAIAYKKYEAGFKIYSNLKSMCKAGEYASPEAWVAYGHSMATWVDRPAWATWLPNPEALQAIKDDKPSYVLLDEIYTWFESRGSGTRSSQTPYTHAVLQSRKSGWNLIYTLQLLPDVDKRVRRNTNQLYIAINYWRFEVLDFTKYPPSDITRSWSNHSWVFPYYDTKEVVETLESISHQENPPPYKARRRSKRHKRNSGANND